MVDITEYVSCCASSDSFKEVGKGSTEIRAMSVGGSLTYARLTESSSTALAVAVAVPIA